jgi:hypothetical protein
VSEFILGSHNGCDSASKVHSALDVDIDGLVEDIEL